MNIGETVKYAASQYDVVNHGVDADTDYVGIVLAINNEGEDSESYTLRVLTPSGRDLTVDVMANAEPGSPGSIVTDTGASTATAKPATPPKTTSEK